MHKKETKMTNRLRFVLLVTFFTTAVHAGPEVFGKGSVSRSYVAQDKYTISVSVSGGIAMLIIPNLRLEARYTNIAQIQNRLDIVSTTLVGTLTDIKTETAIYSLGIDIDFMGEKSVFQPFVYLGAGYISTDRSYYFTAPDGTITYLQEPQQQGISGNAGFGFRIRVAHSLALEIEGFAYATNIMANNPLVNLYGTAGLRIYL